MKIAVVIPVHNEHHTLEALAEGIARQLADYDYRILFIDDGSTDPSYRVLMDLRKANDRIDVLKFSRNCGKTQALAAAFARTDADVVITMDADLQDDPEELPRLLAKLDEGCDLVCGWKEERNDPLHKTLPSKVYNGIISKVFGLDIHDVNTGFKAMRGDVARSLVLHADLHRLIPVMAAQAGYRVGEIPVRHHPRRFGKSKYGLARFYEGVRDAGRLWFGARSTSFAWIQVDFWRLGAALGLVLALLGGLVTFGGLGGLAGPVLLGVGGMQVLLSAGLVVVGHLSHALDNLAELEQSHGWIEEENLGGP
ncbi:MAG: glycosyltransferase family 2 protein [Candidatus Hydrogenedentes bacterium]|nr:glycosyltransferase family 2 protein [Candidatus Hydrogenedentota bacterium]